MIYLLYQSRGLGDVYKRQDNNIDNDLSSLAIAEVPESCFEGCSLINNLKFAQDIKAPQAKAFKDCTSLNSITIGKNEENDFTNCD